MVAPPPMAAPGQTPAAALSQKKQVFYFDGEDMVKRDAMVQLDKQLLSLDPVDKDNAEYPFPHVHTENHDDVDPITREIVNPTIGYSKKKAPQSLAALDPVDKENAEYPFAHVHTEEHENVDPITREPVNILKGYVQKPQSLVALDPVDKDNAEYPFPHVHTETHEDVDPITREVVNPVKGYVQMNGMKRVIAQ